MADPGPSDGAPSPAQNTIASVVANAPAFSAADVAQPAAPTESEQPAKRGRGRPKRDAVAVASHAGQDVDASDAPPLADSGAVWAPQFDMRDSGLWYCPKGDNPSWLSSPFRVLGKVRTYEGASWSLYLSFDDPDGGQQLQAIPYGELQGDGATVRRSRP